MEFSNDRTHTWHVFSLDNIQKAQKVVEPWIKKLQKDALLKASVIAQIIFPEKNATNSQTKPLLLRVIYSKFDNQSQETYTITWDITMDISVIEVIVQKSPFKCYGFFKKDLQKHIYEFAQSNEVGLKVFSDSNYMSMTHINIDFATGFNNDFKLVLKSILSQEKLLRQQLKSPELAMVVLNAPLIKEILDGNKEYVKWQNQVELLSKQSTITYNDLENLMVLKDAFYTLICVHTKNLELIKHIISTPLHYRAVNIQHLCNNEPTEKKRVEFRRNCGEQKFYDQDSYDTTHSLQGGTLGQVILLCREIYVSRYPQDLEAKVDSKNLFDDIHDM